MHAPTARSEPFVVVTGGSIVTLASQTGEPTGPVVTVGAEPCVIGRGGGSSVVVDDPEVSVSHCELTATEHGVRVRDLESTNGTFVHQVRLESGGSIYLTSDARLRCGQSWLALQVARTEQVTLARSDSFDRLTGRSTAMRRVFAQLARIAPHDVSVLITGETGTGKELVAHAIHQNSRRASGPFVTVDCTNIPATLAESKLFGHEKGAFTGAVSRQVSPFLDADGGTIFFDELGELPLDLQAKLLRALEARQIQAVGSNRYQPIDVRVIAATRRNLHAEINAGRFRDDLYYRVAQTVVRVPPLRERREDIPDLVARFLDDLGDEEALTRIDRPARERLMRHDWPGNVRELRNLIVAAYAHSAGGPFEVAELLGSRDESLPPPDKSAGARPFAALRRAMLEGFERDYFSNLHKETEGNLSEMSRRSGLARSTVRDLLARYGIRTVESTTPPRGEPQ
jgi:DNA-binding NtrC family response regulator